jgi:hypothetical protein
VSWSRFLYVNSTFKILSGDYMSRFSEKDMEDVIAENPDKNLVEFVKET